jgi:hypothetical protein
MMLFDTTTFNVGINIQNPAARLDIIGDATNPLFKLNNSNFLFADKLRVNNNGDFYSGSINAFGGFGQADFTTDHLNYKFNTSYQTYLAFTNAGGSGNKGGYGIIGSTIASADSDYRLVVLNNDAGTLGSVLKVVSTAINNTNDGFDYTNYGVNVLSNGVFTNTGAGTNQHNMQVDLNFDLLGLDGKTAAVAGELIAGVLMSQSKGDSIKLFDWAMSFYKKEAVTMDASDLIKLKEIISNAENVTVLAKAPILKYLDSVK